MNIRKTTALLMVCFFLASICEAQELSGLWDVQIACPGGGIAFGLELREEAGALPRSARERWMWLLWVPTVIGWQVIPGLGYHAAHFQTGQKLTAYQWEPTL